MKNERNVPKVRFMGFCDDWERREFSKQYVKVSEKNDLSFGTDKIISVANMYFKEDTKESSDDYMRTYNIMRLGDIAFEGNKSKNFAHGRFVENTIGDGIVSHVFDVFRPIADYDLLFWKYIINNEGVMGRIMIRCTKASTMMTNLVADDFLKEKIAVPSLEEQKHIGSFLNGLDNLITIHQHKCETLQKIKKAMLQKMFPKSGSLYPEFRFAGFIDAWEQRELGTVIKENLKPVPKPEGEYIRLGIRSHAKGTFHEVVPAGGGLDVDTMYAVEANNLIVNITFAWEEAWAITTDEDAEKLVSHRFPQYKFNSNQYPIFYKYRFNNARMKYDLELASPGGAGRNRVLNKSAFLKIPVCIPTSYEEQQQIGSYLRNLDNLITIENRKLETLKKLKKSMLQKMFI